MRITCGTPPASRSSAGLEVPEAELTRRRAAGTPPPIRYRSGALAKYARQLSSSSLGAVTDL